MQREPGCTETIVGGIITLAIWAVIINAVATALAVVICVAGYVIWIALLKPIFNALSDWAEKRPYSPPREHPWLKAIANILFETFVSLMLLLFGIDLILMSAPILGSIVVAAWVIVFIRIIVRNVKSAKT